MANQKLEEIWKPIEGYPYYEISTRGRVRSINRTTKRKGRDGEIKIKGKILRQRWNKICKCYFMDLIHENGVRKTAYPHKLTALMFVPNDDPLKKKMIIHTDNNPRNNCADNLQWMTRSEHMKWQFDQGNKNNFSIFISLTRSY